MSVSVLSNLISAVVVFSNAVHSRHGEYPAALMIIVHRSMAAYCMAGGPGQFTKRVWTHAKLLKNHQCWTSRTFQHVPACPTSSQILLIASTDFLQPDQLPQLSRKRLSLSARCLRWVPMDSPIPPLSPVPFLLPLLLDHP